MFHFRDRLKETLCEHELVLECEAFLSGRYAQHLAELDLPVPVWAWMNTLAHGSSDQIMVLGTEPACARL